MVSVFLVRRCMVSSLKVDHKNVRGYVFVAGTLPQFDTVRVFQVISCIGRASASVLQFFLGGRAWLALI